MMNPPSDPAPPEEEEEERSVLLAALPPASAPLSPPKDPATNAAHRSLWPKLRTTLKAASVVGQATRAKRRQKRLSLTREDSFLKKFSTRHGVCPHRDAADHPTDDRAETSPETDRPYNAKDSEPGRRRRLVIRPDENFMFYWLTLNTSAVLYNLWTSIAREAFPEIQDGWEVVWISADVLCDLIYLLDVVVQLRTGYLERGLIVYETGKLARHYVRSWAFLLDVASLVPLDLVQLYTGLHPLVRFPRFLKSYRLHRYIHMMETRTVYPNMWRVVNLTHVLFLGSHWFAAFYFLISKAHDFQSHWGYPRPIGNYSSVAQKYLRSLYWSTLTLTTIGDLSPPESNWEHVFTIVSYLIGVFVFATIVGQVGNVITNRNASRQEFERLLDGAKSYMRNHNVPLDMQRHVQRWYDYAWSRGCMNGGGDINALGLLPDKLKTELALHVHLDTLRKVTIFQECEPEFLHDLVLKMRTYIFTPGDLICRKGEVAREMFIIADGLLEVISERGEILTQMSTGDFFGEIGILNLDGGVNRRTADVRSVGYSELIVLSRDDVLMALKDHPEAEILIKDYGQRRLLELGAHNRKRMSVRLAPSVEGNSVLRHPGLFRPNGKPLSTPATSDCQPPTSNSVKLISNRSSRSIPHPTVAGPRNLQRLLENSADKVDSLKWKGGWKSQGGSGLPGSRTGSDTSGGDDGESGTSDEITSKDVTRTPGPQTDQSGVEEHGLTPGWEAGSCPSKSKDLASVQGKRQECDRRSSWKRNLRLENCFRRHRVIVKTDTRDTLLSPDMVEPNHDSINPSAPADIVTSTCDLHGQASLTTYCQALPGNVLTGSEAKENASGQNMRSPLHSADTMYHTQRGSRKRFNRFLDDPVPLIPTPTPHPAPGRPGVRTSIPSDGKLKRISTGKPTRCRSSASVFFDNQVYDSSSSEEEKAIEIRKVRARGRYSVDLGHASPNVPRDVFGQEWLTKRTDILGNAPTVDRPGVHPGRDYSMWRSKHKETPCAQLVPRAYGCSSRNSVIVGRWTTAPTSNIDELERPFGGRITDGARSSVMFSEPCMQCNALESSNHSFHPLPSSTDPASVGYFLPGGSRNLVNQYLSSSDLSSIATASICHQPITMTLSEGPQLKIDPMGAADPSASDVDAVNDPLTSQCLHKFLDSRDLENMIQKTISTFLAERQALYEDRIRQLEAENATKTAEIHHLVQALQRSTQVAYSGDNTEK